jgi:mRNA interferase YafO
MRIFKGRILMQQLTEEQADQLVADFRNYKQHGLVPNTFGRDAAYDHPNTPPMLKAEQLRHIHLIPSNVSHKQITPQYRRTSDVHLIYCQGALDEASWCLIAILAPDAHKQALEMNIMLKLAKVAENFRSKY